MVMAITTNKFNWNPQDVTAASPLPVKEHAIQGRVFEAQFVLSDIQLIAGTFTEDDIKKELANKLVYELMKSKHIEFTKVPDLMNSNHVFRARIFAVPDTNVRILRETKVI
jgi:hypothetical protein